ncbi:MAG: efflux RND transporter periplasmic adaptor subunit, partial [Myxococcales bacterium]|nr:efflux RND transporter periplasmic adaptor subunit [Myxococcales bacterium]
MKPLRHYAGRVLAGVALIALGIAVGWAMSPAPNASSSESAPHATQEHEEHSDASDGHYYCPMHPQVRSNEPGQCPICGMDLVATAMESAPTPNTVTLSPWARELLRVRTSEVTSSQPSGAIQVFGWVRQSEDAETSVTAWTAGRLTRVYVDTVGEEVERGQRLARIYSPELVIAQETMLHAQSNLAEARASGSATRERSAHAAQSELRLLGMSSRQIQDVLEEGEAEENVLIRSPASGTVLQRHVLEGEHVQRGTPILSLANLSEVWIQLELPELDAAAVR